jgi:hypothetical protein
MRRYVYTVESIISNSSLTLPATDTVSILQPSDRREVQQYGCALESLRETFGLDPIALGDIERWERRN